MEHRHSLVSNCKISMVRFLMSLLTKEDVPVPVQMESLHCFAFLNSYSDDILLFELLADPTLLVPLASDNQKLQSWFQLANANWELQKIFSTSRTESVVSLPEGKVAKIGARYYLYTAHLYCKVKVPFVMEVTGGDTDRLHKTVEESKVYAAIPRQIGKQVVTFLAAVAIMAEQFPKAFSGYSPQENYGS